MPEPFRPTHRLTVQWPGRPAQVVVLQLDAPRGYGSLHGCAYTEAEWARDDAASWEHRGEDGWMLDGIPLMQPHPDRPAATSVQVERLGR